MNTIKWTQTHKTNTFTLFSDAFPFALGRFSSFKLELELYSAPIKLNFIDRIQF